MKFKIYWYIKIYYITGKFLSYRYVYGGILSLNEQDTSDILKVLIAADELHLQEIVDPLQNYLIKIKSEWMEQNFEFTQRISFQYNNLSTVL